MTKCLYVGNLPHECGEEELRSLFATDDNGPEKVTIVLDRRTGKSRGFAFVDMPSEEAAAAALESLKGKELSGRPLKLGTAHKDKFGQTEGASSRDDYGGYGRPRGGGGRRSYR